MNRAIVLGTLPDRPDPRCARRHLVVDDDAPPRLDPGLTCEGHLRLNPGGDDDEVGRERTAILQLD